MRTRTLTAVALPIIAALGLAAGPATATPVAPEAQAIHYTVARSGDSAVIKTTGAKLTTKDGRLDILDAAGNLAMSLPLTLRRDNVAYPIAAKIDAGTATLTPDRTHGTVVADAAEPQSVLPASRLQNVAESFNLRDQQALLVLSQRATTGSVVSAVLGAIVGGGGGCLLGAAVGATSAGLVSLGLGALPGGVVGCLAGMAILGPIGAIGGLILAGGPILAFSAFQYFSTILSPCTTPTTYCQDPAAQLPVLTPKPANPAKPGK